MLPLPIDDHEQEITQAIRTDGSVVIQASPGAGKTTRVPSMVLDSDLLSAGHIVLVLEPSQVRLVRFDR